MSVASIALLICGVRQGDAHQTGSQECGGWQARRPFQHPPPARASAREGASVRTRSICVLSVWVMAGMFALSRKLWGIRARSITISGRTELVQHSPQGSCALEKQSGDVSTRRSHGTSFNLQKRLCSRPHVCGVSLREPGGGYPAHEADADQDDEGACMAAQFVKHVQ